MLAAEIEEKLHSAGESLKLLRALAEFLNDLKKGDKDSFTIHTGGMSPHVYISKWNTGSGEHRQLTSDIINRLQEAVEQAVANEIERVEMDLSRIRLTPDS